MAIHSKKSQYAQLLAITFGHFTVDLISGIMPSVLPALREHFRLNISGAAMLLGAFFMTCNFTQVLTGCLRPDKTRPLFLYIGLVLAPVICFFAFVPDVSSPQLILLIMIVVSGIGIGSIHPEGLRATHTLDKIPPAKVTAFFMSGGITGFALGCYTGPLLVEHLGLIGLCWFILPASLSLIAIIIMQVRLAADSHVENDSAPDKNQIKFFHIMLAAVPLCTATTIFVGLLPTRLEELGFTLSMGGFSIMAFNLGGAIGAFGWVWVAGKRSNMFAANLASFLALPILVAYLLLIEHDAAKYLLFFAGACGLGGYPLLVTVAKGAVGASLGIRMGFIVGGTWGIAAIIMILLGPLGDAKGVSLLIKLAITCYLLSSVTGIYTTRRAKHRN